MPMPSACYAKKPFTTSNLIRQRKTLEILKFTLLYNFHFLCVVTKSRLIQDLWTFLISFTLKPATTAPPRPLAANLGEDLQAEWSVLCIVITTRYMSEWTIS